ncbi:MAG: ANTAR domain-containing protein [Treponema sp.]|nr:ANTAR domain-containing protein [Treponema sp.]
MDGVLIASNTSSTMLMLSDLMRGESIGRIVAVQNGSEGRRYITDCDFELIIIDSPLKDETGIEFAISAAEKTTAGIMLMVDAQSIFDVSLKVEEYGVFALPKPISPDFFYQAAKLLTASRKRVLRLEDENQKLQRKIEEIRTVDRAKLILVQVLKMTEPQAQHYIEKQSMDLRQTRLTTAENILRTYER